MKRAFAFIAAIAVVWLMGPPVFAALKVEPNALRSIFEKANAAYRGGDYAQATSLYESLIQQGWKNQAVYYNLGNAFFKQQRVGPAIVRYEQARRLAPRDRDVLANLGYAKGLLEYRIEDRRNWYLKAGETLLQSFTQEEMGLISLCLGLIFWLSWGMGLYRAGNGWGWKRKLLLTLTLVSTGLWVMRGTYEMSVEEAIVLKPQAAVRFGPSYKDQIAFRLGEGLKVRIGKKAGDWYRVLLVNGETGWMSQEEMGLIDEASA